MKVAASVSPHCNAGKKSFLPWIIFGLGVSVAAVWWLADYRRGVAWAQKAIRRAFPDVFHMSCDALAEKMSSDPSDRPIIVDVRSAEEYSTSHLAGALSLDESRTEEDLRSILPEGRELVLYCSAGWRASRMVRKLKGFGYRMVANLEGGIFQWANEGREVVKDGSVVAEVHPFHSAFSRMLHPERRRKR